jgi:hypothetical protein
VSAALPDGGTLTLDIRGAELSGGPRLSIRATRCDEGHDCSARVYTSDLRAADLAVDRSVARATLQTTLAGRSLVVRWRPDSGTAVIGSGYLDGDDGASGSSNYVGDGATVTVQYADHTCTGTGGVGQGVVTAADPAGSGSSASIADLRVPAGVTLRC